MSEAPEKASFMLVNHNPDVLTCIANLSNDEVFTPPAFAKQMLDSLETAWAESNGGASIWADSAVTFLDPFTKSGVFLREIVARLSRGLADEIPDLQERVDHILTNQVFGIGITTLTSLLARRSVYCSKYANGPHSIARSFDREWGNIWFERTEHTWVGGRESDELGPDGHPSVVGRTCKYCPATERDYGRGKTTETHAYALLHTDNVKARMVELFGADMQFDVIIGNPPYQLGSSGGDSIGSFAMPIYQKFVEAAKALEPRFLTMVIPSRWFAGGRGLDDFRREMLADRRLRALTDYPEARDVFEGVDIAGGVSHFLWDSMWSDKCEVVTVVDGIRGPGMARFLDEYDILVRYNEAVSILHRVLDAPEVPFASYSHRVAPIQPFSLRTNFRGRESDEGMIDPVVVYQSNGTGYIERTEVPRNVEWVDQWKVIVGGAVPAGGRSDRHGRFYGLTGVRVLPPGTACTETYLVAGRFATETEALNCAAFLKTKFARFLISLRTNTQHLYSERFAFLPDLPMDRTWTAEELYERWGLTADEIDYIESRMREYEAADASA